jgi:ATP-binding protein involved in chromosome partitioning
MAFFWKKRAKETAASVEPEAPKTQQTSQAAEAAPTPSRVRYTIAIASGKGGVGKSTVTANLAHALAAQGARVGVLDADIYGPSQPQILGTPQGAPKVTPDEKGILTPVNRGGVKIISMGLLMQGDGPVVWRAPMATKMIQQFLGGVKWGELDYLLIDLPPGTGDVQLTLAQQARLSGAIIVTTPQQVAVGIAKKGLRMFQNLNVPILGIVENMSSFHCEHCGNDTAIFKTGGGMSLAQELDLPFLGAIPLDPTLMMSADAGVPVMDLKPESHASQAFEAMARNLETQVLSMGLDAGMAEPKEVALTVDGELRITWPEGRMIQLNGYSLRVRCACAACVDENTGARKLDPAKVDPAIRVVGAQGVGRYALSITFSDGHATGIYPFKKLREFTNMTAPEQEKPVSQDLAWAANDSTETKLRQILEKQINPGLAGHGGKAELAEYRDGKAYLRLSGGCQGCGAAQMTLRQGIEKTIRALLPEVSEIIDITDHAAGENPYYKHPVGASVPELPIRS